MEHDPVYVSLTSIVSHQDILLRSLESLVQQTRVPNGIFVYLSKEPYLFDEGFENGVESFQPELQKWMDTHSDVVHVEFVPNTGPHRKWLPILARTLNDSCFVVTVDDDTVYHPSLIQNMLEDYAREQCAISYRGFGLTFKYSLAEMSFEACNPVSKPSASRTLFATGKGGILFRPEMFRAHAEWILDSALCTKWCPFAADIWWNLCRIAIGAKLFVNNSRTYMTADLTRVNDSLWEQVNKHDNRIQQQAHNVVTFLVSRDILSDLVFDSIRYWNDRYLSGQTSGIGSYGEQAQWKGRELQHMIDRWGINEIIDHGCGDGNMAQHFQVPVYVGLDPSIRAIQVCRMVFAKDNQRGFCVLNEFLADPQLSAFKAMCALSIDVLGYLVERNMFDTYLRQLFAFATTYVIVYARDEDARVADMKHIRHRMFTKVVEREFSEWERILTVPHTKGFAFHVYKKKST